MSSVAAHVAPVAATERLDSVTLRSVDGSTEAAFVPAANMVCSSLRYLGVECLHQGAGVEAYARNGMTMGIPLLHPWANRVNGFRYRVGGEEVALPRGENVIPLDDVGLPIHGAMRQPTRWSAARDWHTWRPDSSIAPRFGSRSPACRREWVPSTIRRGVSWSASRIGRCRRDGARLPG